MLTKKGLTIFLVLLLTLTSLDQATKSFFISYLNIDNYYNIHLLPILDIIYSWNYGISFGLFKDYYQYSNLAFSIINSLIVTYLIYSVLTVKPATPFYGTTLIIAGALGNLLDRFFRGAVFDFIYFHYNDFHFPAFNLADSFITIGVTLAIIEYYRSSIKS